MEAADQPLPDIRMQMRVHLRPGLFAAPGQKALAACGLVQSLEAVGDRLEVLHSLIVDVALSVAGVVPGEAVAAALTRDGGEDLPGLLDLSGADGEEPGMLAIRKKDAA